MVISLPRFAFLQNWCGIDGAEVLEALIRAVADILKRLEPSLDVKVFLCMSKG